ncbi:MAG: retropepsin-like aspartic protease, partial [Candidatus Krumholzibacteria bacterium]|nr:retropepsin-like aspartic protease [Candidatus Krumholzibacteria bacterium]
GKVLVVDYPNKRFCLVDSLDGALEDLVSRASFVDLQRRNDKLFVPVRIGGMYSENFFLDTGASMLPITTTKALWQRLTGLRGNEKSTIRITVPSWGKEVSLVGAPVKGTLTIGTLQVSNPVAYFASTGLVETDGLLGNALFYDEYTIIIDLRENRFGILKNQLDRAR